MEEKANRILNGEAVDIAEDGANYYLSVSKYDDKYKVGFVSPNYVAEYFTCLNTEMMRDAGTRLIALADELESRKKFKNGDICFFVCPNGSIYDSYISTNDGGHLARIAFGNCFKSREEAEKNKGAVLSKYQWLRDKGLV